MHQLSLRTATLYALLWIALLAVIAGIGAAGLATAASGGVTATTADETENLSLSPTSTSNGERYADVVDGELVVEFEQLNRDATTNADRVFEIESTVDHALDVSVHSQHDDVAFYWRDDSSASATEPHRLEAGASVTVGVTVDSRDGLDDEGTFTVVTEEASEEEDEEQDEEDEREEDEEEKQEDDETEDEPRLVVGERPAQHLSMDVGQEGVGVTVPFENPHAFTIREMVELTVGGVVVDRREVVLEPGEHREIFFELRVTEPGTHEVAMNGRVLGSVTVTERAITIEDASVEPTVVERGAPVLATATVRNDGSSTETVPVSLQIGGTIVEEQAVRVEPGATKTVTFERTFDRRGGYDVSVGGQSAGRVHVESATVASVHRFTGEHRGALGALAVPLLGGAAVAGRRCLRSTTDGLLGQTLASGR